MTITLNGQIQTVSGCATILDLLASLGFDGRPGWRGWDTVWAEMPLSEVSDLIVDLRSLTQGVGTYDMEFSHLAELGGKLADTIVAGRKAA